jgi:hypothetical protein
MAPVDRSIRDMPAGKFKVQSLKFKDKACAARRILKDGRQFEVANRGVGR